MCFFAWSWILQLGKMKMKEFTNAIIAEGILFISDEIRLISPAINRRAKRHSVKLHLKNKRTNKKRTKRHVRLLVSYSGV